MKTLEQIQEENRKFIIIANNPSAETYDEALEMELKFGCIVKVAETIEHFDEDCFIKHSDRESYITLGYYGDVPLKCIKIIGKPLTLSRVLIALNNATKQHNLKAELCDQQYSIYTSCDNNYLYFGDSPNGKLHAEWSKEQINRWDLTKKTLEEQSEETQRKFNELINEI